jgi:hypothetical protein
MAVIGVGGGSQLRLPRRDSDAATGVTRTMFLAGHEVHDPHRHTSDATLTRNVYPGAGKGQGLDRPSVIGVRELIHGVSC